MGLLPYLQIINLYNIHIGQYANKEADLLGPTMLDPTPVSHTIVRIISYDNFANFPLYSIKN